MYMLYTPVDSFRPNIKFKVTIHTHTPHQSNQQPNARALLIEESVETGFKDLCTQTHTHRIANSATRRDNRNWVKLTDMMRTNICGSRAVCVVCVCTRNALVVEAYTQPCIGHWRNWLRVLRVWRTTETHEGVWDWYCLSGNHSWVAANRID